MLETKEMFKESEGWELVPDEDDFWCPSNEGDWVAGIYVKKEDDVGINHATVYTLNNTEGENKIFGTFGLNKKMAGIPIGYEVGIIYKGEKPSKPPKKPFKLFEVHKRKIDNHDEAIPPASSDIKNTLGDVDDPESRQAIIDYTDIYKSENHGKEPKPQDIINLAETDPEMSDMQVLGIKTQLAKDHKNKKAKT